MLLSMSSHKLPYRVRFLDNITMLWLMFGPFRFQRILLNKLKFLKIDLDFQHALCCEN